MRGDACRAEPDRVADQMSTPVMDQNLPRVRDDARSLLGNLDGAINLLQYDQAREDAEFAVAMVRLLGGDTKKYVRERRAALRHLVAEVYSPPRITAAAKLMPELRCIPSFALDLTTRDEDGKPWDFSVYANRERARRMVMEMKPMLLVGSPMCTAFSAWQHINRGRRDPGVVEREHVQAMVHIQFCMELYRLQHEA